MSEKNSKMGTKKKKRIGIIGGTFNPIHNGHLLIAEEARERFGLDKVLFIPVANPPHKRIPDLVKGEYRLKIVELAIKPNPHFSTSDLEIKRGGRSYSIDTIRDLNKNCKKGTKLYFIIGADSMSEFMSWKNWEDMLMLCKFIVFPRPGFKFDVKNFKNKMEKELKNKLLARNIIYFQVEAFDISSTEIRTKIKNKKSLKYILPAEVIKYIMRRKLYKNN